MLGGASPQPPMTSLASAPKPTASPLVRRGVEEAFAPSCACLPPPMPRRRRSGSRDGLAPIHPSFRRRRCCRVSRQVLGQHLWRQRRRCILYDQRHDRGRGRNLLRERGERCEFSRLSLGDGGMRWACPRSSERSRRRRWHMARGLFFFFGQAFLPAGARSPLPAPRSSLQTSVVHPACLR